MSTKADGVSVEEISGWIQKAASAEPGELASGSGSAPASDARTLHIQAALARARKKTYVGMIKPFRNLFREQGTVNDSLIDAIYHLNAQNQDLLEQVQDLRALVYRLRNQLRRMPIREGTSIADAPDDEQISTGSAGRAD